MKVQRQLSALLAICLILCANAPAVKAANPPAQNVVPAGYDDYVSAHQYISKTDDPDVYKVMLSLELSQKNTITTDVVIHANLGHMYYEDGNDLQPITLPNGATVSKVFQLEKYAAQTLVDMLCDPDINANYQNTRIGLTASAVNNGQNFYDMRDISDAQFFSDLVGTDRQQDLLQAIELYNPHPNRNGTLFTPKNGKGGSNKYADAKGLQRAYQLLTDQPLYFQPVGPIRDGNQTSPAEDIITSSPINWTFTRADGSTVASNAATPMWSENPSVAGESNVKHHKFIIWLGAGLMGGNGDRTAWNNAKPNGQAYAVTSDPIGTLDLLNNVANNPNSNIDAPIYQTVDEGAQWQHYHRAHKWTRYHTQAISTLLAQESDNQQLRNLQMLALWPYGVAAGWQGYNNLRMDFLETITTDRGYEAFSSTRGYVMHYYNMYSAPGYVHGSSAVSSRLTHYDDYGGTNNWGNWGDLHIIQSAADLQNTIEQLVSGIVPKVDLLSQFHLASQFDFEGAYGMEVSHGSITQNGRGFSWSVPSVSAGTFTLTFYVRADRDAMQDGIHYPVLDTAYVSYDRRAIPELGESGSSLPVILPYPMAYIGLSGLENPEEGLPSDSPAGVSEGASSPSASGGSQDGTMLPLFAIPYGQSKVHTPSVSPAKQKLEEVPLQERTEGEAQEESVIESESIADAAEELVVANTATTSHVLFKLLACLTAFAILLLLYRAVRRRRG